MHIYTHIPLGTMLRNATSLNCVPLAIPSQYGPIKADLKPLIIRTVDSVPPLILLVMLNVLVPCVLIRRLELLIVHHFIFSLLMITFWNLILQKNIAVPPTHPVTLWGCMITVTVMYSNVCIYVTVYTYCTISTSINHF